MKRKLTNFEVFTTTKMLAKAISLNRNGFRWNYCLQKNLEIFDRVFKPVQAALPILKEKATAKEKDAYDKDMADISAMEQEVDVYTIEEHFVPADANAVETELYFKYLQINTEDNGKE